MLTLRRAPPASAPPIGSWARSTTTRRGAPLAWIDDSFDESCYEWARGASSAGEPTLLVPTDSDLGLEEAHAEALGGAGHEDLDREGAEAAEPDPRSL